MVPASLFEISKCRLSKNSTPSQKDWCRVVLCHGSNVFSLSVQ